jgi:cysteine synthase A
MNVIDEIVTVSTDNALNTTILMAKNEGICCGISSGANVYAALELSKKAEYKEKMIVTMTCDYGERYLSSPIGELLK